MYKTYQDRSIFEGITLNWSISLIKQPECSKKANKTKRGQRKQSLHCIGLPHATRIKHTFQKIHNWLDILEADTRRGTIQTSSKKKRSTIKLLIASSSKRQQLTLNYTTCDSEHTINMKQGWILYPSSKTKRILGHTHIFPFLFLLKVIFIWFHITGNI